MVKDIRIYLEGAGDSKEQRTRCRAAFSKICKAAGFENRMPSFIACGSRGEAFADFKAALKVYKDTICILLVDSEDPVQNLSSNPNHGMAWEHLKKRDNWSRPSGVENFQALLMATCMEAWIVTDKEALVAYYGSDLQLNALPALEQIESRDRHIIQEALEHATRKSKKSYKKGNRSFNLFATLNPSTLKSSLTQFQRLVSVLDELMPSPNTTRQ